MNFKHGKINSRLYRIWANMKSRCTNPKATRYATWGGRGITICDEWSNDFQSFYDWSMTHGYQDDLTIDRIDPDGNYEPENCRWVSYQKQNLNKKSIPVYEVNGIVFHQSEVERLFGVKRTTFQQRLKRGWTVERAVT